MSLIAVIDRLRAGGKVEDKVNVSVSMPPALVERIDSIAATVGSSRAAVIREFVDYGCEQFSEQFEAATGVKP